MLLFSLYLYVSHFITSLNCYKYSNYCFNKANAFMTINPEEKLSYCINWNVGQWHTGIYRNVPITCLETPSYSFLSKLSSLAFTQNNSHFPPHFPKKLWVQDQTWKVMFLDNISNLSLYPSLIYQFPYEWTLIPFHIPRGGEDGSGI